MPIRYPAFDTFAARTGLTPHPGEFTDPDSHFHIYATVCDLAWSDDPNGWYTLFNEVVVNVDGYEGLGAPILDVAYNAAVPGAFGWPDDSAGFFSPDAITGDDVSIGISYMHDLGGGHWSTYDPDSMWGGSLSGRNYYVDQAHADADFGSHPAIYADGSNAAGNWAKLGPIPTGHHGMSGLLYQSQNVEESLFFVGSYFQLIAQVSFPTGGTTYPNFPGHVVATRVPFSLGTPPGVAINGGYPGVRKSIPGVAVPKGFARW